jgi:hypothetical protein
LIQVVSNQPRGNTGGNALFSSFEQELGTAADNGSYYHSDQSKDGSTGLTIWEWVVQEEKQKCGLRKTYPCSAKNF